MLSGDISNIQAKSTDFNYASLTDFEDSGFIKFRFHKWRYVQFKLFYSRLE